MFRFLTVTQAGCRRSIPRHVLHRITTLAIATCAVLVAQVICAKPVRAEASDRPNIVLIFADDLGYQDLGCFGSPDIRTPRLDAMAQQGMKLTSFYAQPICGPSRAALMTGCYPLRVAERGNIKQVHPILHSDEITVAEVLKTKGYATACFGKWDLAKHAQTGFFMDLFPTRQGFDYFYGTPTSNDGFVDLYRNEERIEPKSDMATLTKRYTDEAIEFMKEHREEPFFVYIPHTMPHTRLDASTQFKGKSPRGLYGDVVEEIDFNVGRVLDAIAEMKLEQNTYVLFTSDNGPWLIKNKDLADGHLPTDHGGSAGPLRSGKVSTFEGGVRVPTIVWGPGRVPAGTTCDTIASTLDILPTLAALAGADVPSDRVIDGEDIRHLFHGRFDEANPEKAFFYYLRVHLQAVRQGKWKLHLVRDERPVGAAPFSENRHIALADRVGFDEPFLVDLENDLGETTNVARRHPDVVRRLLALAEAMREDLGDYDRVGKNMRFFDPIDPRPEKPPVPPTRKPQPRVGPKKPAAKPRKTAPAIKQPPVDFNHPPRDYVTRELHGWPVLVEKQLVDEAPELAKKTLARLEEKLGEVVAVLPAATLPDLRKVKIFLMYGPKAKAGGRDNGLEYFQRHAPEHHHWLDPRMGSSIVIFNAENYATISELWARKSLAHEFGHAHHLEHWPENRADIYDTWDHAVKAGLYQTVQEEDKAKYLPNYAAQNHLEYFAELTAMYFVGANYFPYDRSGLKAYDPDGYELVQKRWGVSSE